jgi:hypothetical protein
VLPRRIGPLLRCNGESVAGMRMTAEIFTCAEGHATKSELCYSVRCGGRAGALGIPYRNAFARACSLISEFALQATAAAANRKRNAVRRLIRGRLARPPRCRKSRPSGWQADWECARASDCIQNHLESDFGLVLVEMNQDFTELSADFCSFDADQSEKFKQGINENNPRKRAFALTGRRGQTILEKNSELSRLLELSC